MDGVSIHTSNESFSLFCESNGHFTLICTREGEAKFKLSKVRSTQTCQKGIPYLNTYDGRILRYANPLIKPNDTVKIDLKSNKIVDAIKLDVGSIVMVTGGRNRGCIGVINKREKHKENLEIIHVQNSQGHEFDTNLCHVFTIGKAVIPFSTSKEIFREDHCSNGSQLSESGVSFEMPNSFRNSNVVSDAEDDVDRLHRMKGLNDLEDSSLIETSIGEVTTLKRKNRRKQLTKVLENSAMLCGEYFDSKCSHNNSDSTGVSFENCSSEYHFDGITRLIPDDIQKVDCKRKLEDDLYCYGNNVSKWQSKGKRKARHKNRTKKRDHRKYSSLNSGCGSTHLKNEDLGTCSANFQGKPTFCSNEFSQLTSESQSQKQLPYRKSRSFVNSKYRSSYVLGKSHQFSKLYDVKVEVDKALFSLSNGTIEGEELPVMVMEDGFCDDILLGTQKSRSLCKHSSKKMRKLSSFTGERVVQRRKCGDKLEEDNACVPLTSVFNRIHEALNRKCR